MPDDVSGFSYALAKNPLLLYIDILNTSIDVFKIISGEVNIG